MARKGQGTKGSKGSADIARVKSDRVVLKLSLDRETVRRLKLESFGRDVSVGLVVDELVQASPRRFVLMDRARGAQGVEVPAAVEPSAVLGPVVARPALGVVSEAG